jgi:superfamily II DNA or RNA helicase
LSPRPLLEALEALPLPEPPKARAARGDRGPDRFAWHLAPKGNALHVDVLTCREIPRGWHELDRLPHGYLPAPGEDEWAELGAGERAALEALQVWNRKPGSPLFPLLSALEGHTRVSWAPGPGYTGTRVALAREICALVVQKHTDGWRLSLSRRPEAGPVALRLEGDRLLFTGFTPLHRALDALLGEGARLAADQGPRLARVLARLLPHLPLLTDLEPEPLPPETPPDRRLGLWLKGGGERLNLRAFTAPAPGVPWQAPGSGPAAVVAGDPQARVLRRRDLLLEARRLDQVKAILPGSARPLPEPLSWRIEDREAVAAFLAGLRDLGTALRLEGVPGLLPRLPHRPDLALALRETPKGLEVAGTLDGRPLAPLLADLRGASRFLHPGDGSILDLSGLPGLRHLAAWGQPSGEAVRVPAAARPVLAALGACAPAAVPEAPPAAFQGTLRAYQTEGFRWMAALLDAGLGACLADDMGLGKTVQTAALLAHRASRGAALVIAPTSVAANWRAELARFAPSLRVRLLAEADRAATLEACGPGDVVVASYGLLLSEAEALERVPWDTVVLDEAHAIKNAETQRAQASRRLRTAGRLALTGTPVENHPGELAALMGWLLPGLEARFRGAPDGETLKLMAAPFLLRRRKAEVLKELPPRTDLTVRVELDEAERTFHQDLLARCRAEALAGGVMNVLAALMKLRRACAHPSLAEAGYRGPGAKADLLLERLAILKEEGHRCLVFCQFTDFLDLLEPRLDQAGLVFVRLDGGMPAKARQRSVDTFQSGGADVFLLSLRAGGTGLNLTAADDVFHLDPWWNPAVEDQASDRAHRMGRTRPVTVHRLVAAGTVEERVLALHAAKRAMVEDLLEGREQALPLDRTTLEALLD